MMIHMPLAAAVLLPMLWCVLVYFTRTAQFPPKVWVLFLLLAVVLNAANGLSYLTGIQDAHFLAPEDIQSHLQAAINFVICSASILALAIWQTVHPPKREEFLKIALLLASLANLFFAIGTGHLGGHLR